MNETTFYLFTLVWMETSIGKLTVVGTAIFFLILHSRNEYGIAFFTSFSNPPLNPVSYPHYKQK